MEQITIIKPNATTIDLMRTSPVINITSAIQNRVLGEQDVIELQFESAEILPIDILDKIIIFGEEYKLNDLPSIQKNSNNFFVYNCIFEGSQYDLLKVQLLNSDVSGGSTGTSFDITGNIEELANIIINNLNRVYPAKWSLVFIPDTDVKTLSFSETNCLEALQNICNEFSYEFEITQGANGLRYLAIKKLGNLLPNQFEYGIYNGLYSISRQRVDKRNLITRLYAYGSENNLNSNYRNFSQRLKFNESGYIENITNISTYGLIEGVKIFDEVFPSRRGTITGVDANKRSFVDSEMFNLNETDTNGTKWLIAGITAKISMVTGNLAGYEFELESYNNTSKKFTVKEYKDNRGEIFPSATITAFQFEINDTYTILDIRLPDSYITTAEAELKEKAQKYLDENSEPTVNYQVEIDELYLDDLPENTTSPTANLPTGWVYTDINNLISGFAQYVQSFLIVSQGDAINVGNTSDSFGFLHRAVTVDFGQSLISNITIEPNYYGTNSPIANTVKFGIMMRADLTNSSKFVALRVENGQIATLYRATVGGAVQLTGTGLIYDPKKIYGLYYDIDGNKVQVLEFLYRKFRRVLNEVQITLTAPEKASSRIGYFITNTDLDRAVLKVDSQSSSQNPTTQPPTTTPLGDLNYINIANNENGAATLESGKYVLRNSGIDIWDNTDSFGYLYATLGQNNVNLNATLVCEPNYLNTAEPLNVFARHGLMVRFENVANARHVSIGKNADGSIFMFHRVGAAGTQTDITGQPHTGKQAVTQFYINVALTPGFFITNRPVRISVGYIENGQQVQVGYVDTLMSAAELATVKIGIFNSSKDAFKKSVLRASNLDFAGVLDASNPCNKPNTLYYSNSKVQFGSTTAPLNPCNKPSTLYYSNSKTQYGSGNAPASEFRVYTQGWEDGIVYADNATMMLKIVANLGASTITDDAWSYNYQHSGTTCTRAWAINEGEYRFDAITNIVVPKGELLTLRKIFYTSSIYTPHRVTQQMFMLT